MQSWIFYSIQKQIQKNFEPKKAIRVSSLKEEEE